jgi:GT2 family glycosyltransferase
MKNLSNAARRIQIVFANFHCGSDIAECLESLAALATATAVDVVVVENGGPKFSASERVVKSFGPPRVLHPSLNVGYFGALRCALDAVQEGDAYQMRILCNPDIEFFEGDPLCELAAVASRHGAAIVAPSVISTRAGRDQNPYMLLRPGLLTRLRWRIIYSSFAVYILNEWISEWWRQRRHAPARRAAPLGNERIYAAHGSFLALSEEFVQSMRTHFNLIPFLYGEELVLAELCQKYGWVTLYVPSVAIRHREHSSTGKLASRQRFGYQRQSILRFFALFTMKAASAPSEAPAPTRK